VLVPEDHGHPNHDRPATPLADLLKLNLLYLGHKVATGYLFGYLYKLPIQFDSRATVCEPFEFGREILVKRMVDTNPRVVIADSLTPNASDEINDALGVALLTECPY